jgi:hypothetical protein
LAAETLAKGGAAEPEPERDSGGDRSADDGAEPLKVRDSPGVPPADTNRMLIELATRARLRPRWKRQTPALAAHLSQRTR